MTPRARRWHQPSHLPSPRELGKHPGEWVAIVNRKIVAAGTDPRRVLAEGRTRSRGLEPSMLHVPAGEVQFF
ncbi:MAG: hypothetical protein KGJ23_15375 [Euryarchaeota archaeon]|nr:hypothetical protein [Euryarchaeota archaeon]MDE1882104.1 hypothetical protein [Euryarchaeota archaeon]MDE2046419.1 hypothetical protein [Thermoplasmata archaeon]